MAKTQSDLINQALTNLAVVGSGQTASANDTAIVEGWVEPMLADLAARDIGYIPDANDIDDAVYPWLAILLAQWSAPAFGQPMDQGAFAMAQSRIREVISTRIHRPDVVLDRTIARGFRW